jgi:HEXXH motif-containing protein
MLPEYVNDSRLWFPGLAQYLMTDLVSRDQGRRGLVDHYGTQRWLTGDANASIVGMGTVRLGRHLSIIEQLPVSTIDSFSNLTFADDKGSHACAQIQEAAEVLDSVNTLADTVGCLARSIHLLRASIDHDISHSSPHLPFSVFVSIPEPTERDASLRVAESLIHESMHLQLTLLDTIEPLVDASGTCGYSPWKQEIRPVEGLLHGIYVFAVIHQTLGVLADLQPASQAYCVKRRNAIQAEVGILPAELDGLSATGDALWQRSRRCVMRQ